MSETLSCVQTITIENGIATLEDGTTINLAPIQEYLGGCYQTTKYQPYADMADQMALLTGVDWRTT